MRTQSKTSARKVRSVSAILSVIGYFSAFMFNSYGMHLGWTLGNAIGLIGLTIWLVVDSD